MENYTHYNNNEVQQNFQRGPKPNPNNGQYHQDESESLFKDSGYDQSNMSRSTPYQSIESSTHQESSDTNGIQKQNKMEQFLLFALITAISITAIVIGVGWALFYPKTDIASKGEQAVGTTVEETQIDEITKDANQDLIIVYGTEDSARLDEEQTIQQSDVQNSAVASASPNASVQSQASSSAVVDKQNSAASSTSTSVETNASTSIETAAVTRKETSATISTTTASSNAQSNSLSVVARSDRPAAFPDTKYWIQIFSTNNMDKANNIKNTLDLQGVKAIIVTKNIKNSIYYRLRIGPYYNKEESNKFLQWIKRSKEYGDAYVSVEKG